MTGASTSYELFDPPSAGECWCCGRTDDPEAMVHLGRHPEVELCRGCARWAGKQAAELDDRGRSGPLVTVRGRLRSARQAVIRRGWHRNRVVGGVLRRIGRWLP